MHRGYSKERGLDRLKRKASLMLTSMMIRELLTQFWDLLTT